ncbi:MAG: acyl-CoA synthetase (AMP-forming)/AMP-acid ligase II [Candidatus Poriferisodalaceae bacterium]|jgi:3-oxocholest-4-en-26-oate---CoA ligase
MNATPVTWHFADVFETMAASAPDRLAIVHGDNRLTWRRFDERANALAADLAAAGLSRQGKVMTYLYNSAEYLETAFGSLKASFVPVNVNYRYGPDEIRYLFENADAEAAVFDVDFAPLLAEIRDELPLMKRWLAVGPRDQVPDWATAYEDVATSGAGLPDVPWERHPDDLIMVYTGGTTGMPKGVMWTQNELFLSMGMGGNAALGIAGVSSLDELAERTAAPDAKIPIVLEACPLMHATALGHSFAVLPAGATIVLLEGSTFDPQLLWSEVERHGVNWLTMVGDAFGRPLLAELDAAPDRWNLESLGIVYSAGVMWSQEVKDGFFRHLPDGSMLLDALGSTEAPGLGSSVSTAGQSAATARFTIGEFAQVITDDDRFVEPGSGEIGMTAFGGHMPLGYYKDEAKTAATFRMVGGQRWSIPGDYATVEVDGTLTLLGRGSVCINTGGEKVFPEEVEEILKLHPGVRDAVCVGIPDERFGQRVCAVVEAEPGADAPALAELADLTKSRLAGYKAPRDLVLVPSIGRAPSGKVDYKGLTAHAVDTLKRDT